MLFTAFHTYAQVPKAVKPALTAQQQWVKNQVENFYGDGNINVSRDAMVKLYLNTIKNPHYSTCSNNVQVLKLDGERINASTVKLKWVTQGETENNRFEVERLFYNNRAEAYTGIGKVCGYGRRIGKSKYQLTDDNGYSGKTFYRLRQLDGQGKLIASRVISVDGYPIPATLKPFPNPSRSADIGLEFSGFEEERNIRLQVFDSKGSLVYSMDGIDPLKTGNILHLRGMNLNDGLYFIHAVGKEKKGNTSILIH